VSLASDDALAEVLAEVDSTRETVMDDGDWVLRLSRLFVLALNRADHRRAVAIASQLSTVARNAAIRLELAGALERGATAIANAGHQKPTKKVVRVGRRPMRAQET
jgi:hypothetical protein